MPTIRRPQADFMFVRDGWPVEWKQAPIKLRLLSRTLFQPGGLTEVERAVLRRIAEGSTPAAELVAPGVLDHVTARKALDWPWLK